MSDDNSEGSWIPSVVVSVLIVLWWISRSQSIKAVQIRRWYSVKRVQWKKKLGLRDESIYKNGAAGDGANLKHKRQG
eukprot:CAMPEP_0116078230 /NCGR_PEP_ID=MMETSP0327-20121206/489_1 /TAXON_ID=44447 /ORGANISM="Pseudo-nitzschia delicatissima, Strain B596" /LENGTH=76 /DNA_ID=CAMNT_0003568757 /DNA_START=44 /DNA_END=274 /DNA_ORIENTATION=+